MKKTPNPVWYLNPRVVFVVTIILSIASFLIVPEAMFAEWSIYVMASPWVLAEIFAICVGGFLLGSMIPVGKASNDPGNDEASGYRALAYVKLLNVLATIALFVTVVALLALGGLQAISDSMHARGRTVSIDGLTTFTHASTAAMILGVCIRTRFLANRRIRRASNIAILIAAALCTGRSVLAGERVAILIPTVGAVFSWLLLGKVPLRASVIFRFALLIVFVGGVFIASERLRSFAIKQEKEGLDQSLVDYSLDRFARYYALSVNAGAGRYMLFKNEQCSDPIFWQSVYPLAKMMSIANVALVWFPSNTPPKELLEATGMYNPEFTNTWGFASPLSEHPLWGFLYWGMWGAYLQRLYRLALRGQIGLTQAAAFGLGLVGIVEAARVNMLGAIHIQLPLILLILRSDSIPRIQAATANRPGLNSSPVQSPAR